MVALVWHPSLPQYVNREGFRRGYGDSRLVTATEIGPGKTRRRTAAKVMPVSFTMWFTPWQLNRFEEFYEDDAEGGTKAFWFPAIGKHGFPFYAEDGSILLKPDGGRLLQSAWWWARFSAGYEPPEEGSIGDELWEVPVNLDILP